ncbi:hypothetical protein KMM349_24610 [Stenotrophomonas maltophilia]|nr:hypothetical protein KMM349_24610 [Stenotrophomonas maltophilia]
MEMRRASRNPVKAADGIADIPSGSRSSHPLQDPRLPPMGGPRRVFRRSQMLIAPAPDVLASRSRGASRHL